MLKVNFKIKEFLQINKWSTVYIAFWPPYVQTKRTKDDLLLEGGSEVLKFIPTIAFKVFHPKYSGPKIAHYSNLALTSKQNCWAVTSPKKRVKCTQDTIWVCLVCFLGELTARQFCFDIYWPLDCDFFGCQSGVQCNAVAASNHQQLKKELNVSKSWKQITTIWILPKNKPNALSASGYYTESRSLSLPECIPFDFWKNPQRLNLLSRFSDLYKKNVFQVLNMVVGIYFNTSCLLFGGRIGWNARAHSPVATVHCAIHTTIVPQWTVTI